MVKKVSASTMLKPAWNGRSSGRGQALVSVHLRPPRPAPPNTNFLQAIWLPPRLPPLSPPMTFAARDSRLRTRGTSTNQRPSIWDQSQKNAFARSPWRPHCSRAPGHPGKARTICLNLSLSSIMTPAFQAPMAPTCLLRPRSLPYLVRPLVTSLTKMTTTYRPIPSL